MILSFQAYLPYSLVYSICSLRFLASVWWSLAQKGSILEYASRHNQFMGQYVFTYSSTVHLSLLSFLSNFNIQGYELQHVQGECCGKCVQTKCVIHTSHSSNLILNVSMLYVLPLYKIYKLSLLKDEALCNFASEMSATYLEQR